ncbi:MAG TPA: hypothetical protein VKP65_23465 [Rhodothermales bacterium]|nr:hypothetical protein [Rhodothermales bacterium]
MQQLTVGNIINEAIQIGLKNMISLLGAVLLWLLTIWIPYLNVGTTIGLFAIVLAMSRDEGFSPGEVFDPKYRKYMGEFFLLMGFMYFGTLIGLAFFVIPGMVISIAWGQAIYIMFDKGTSPLESIKLSNEITYGEKWTIFIGTFALVIVLYIAMFILIWVFSNFSDLLAGISALAGMVAMVSIAIGAQAYIYRVLSQRLDMPNGVSVEEKPTL